MQMQDHIPLEDGWQKMEGGFSKFIDIMEGGFREPFALALHSELYTYDELCCCTIELSCDKRLLVQLGIARCDAAYARQCST